MKTGQIKIKIPSGYEVDKENSTPQEITLKKKEKVHSLHSENDLLLFRYPEKVNYDTWEKILRYRKHVLEEVFNTAI